MPHLILEYSDNLPNRPDFQALFEMLHSALCQFDRIRLADIKSRAVAHPVFRIGDGGPDMAFMHLTVKVLTGRPVEERKRMADAMLAILEKQLVPLLHSRRYDMTVDICEIERETYGKAASPPT